MADIFDTPLWRHFKDDPEMKKSSLSLALMACTDGASPFKRGKHSFWPVAMEVASLPSWLRHTLAASHLPFIIPGPCKKKDFQPYLSILSDELLYLYYFGVKVRTPAGHQQRELNCRAMLIQWIGDYPALCATCNQATTPARKGACPRCGQEGIKGPGSKPTIYPGAHRECPGDTQRQARGRDLNRPDKNIPVDSQRVFRKDDAYFVSGARAADQALNDGIHFDKAKHPGRKDGTGESVEYTGPDCIISYVCPTSLIGIHASHAFQLLPSWRENLMRKPDIAHGMKVEGEAIVHTFTGLAYQGTRIEAIAEWEVKVNGRWGPLLGEQAVAEEARRIAAGM